MKYTVLSQSYDPHEMFLFFFLFDPQLLIFMLRIGTGDPVCATELSAAVVRAEILGPRPAQGPH